jgi:hypothetical protein
VIYISPGFIAQLPEWVTRYNRSSIGLAKSGLYAADDSRESQEISGVIADEIKDYE